jgi:hypothetical protein
MPSTTASCKEISAQREQCHNLYGKAGEDCIVLQLVEKRCLAFLHCVPQAKAYYGTPTGPEKAICGSWAEAFCFGERQEETGQLQGRRLYPVDHDHHNDYDDDDGAIAARVRESHQRARNIVNANKQLKAECRTLALDLSKCLQKKL